MRIAAAVAAAVLWSAGAQAACLPTAAHCYDFSTIGAIGDEVVSQEKLPPPPAPKGPEPAAQKFYTGPTAGVSNTPRPAPEVGYHWSIN